MISFCNDARELTRQVIEEFFYGNPEKVLQNFHPDVTWIGAANGQCIRGAEKVSQYISHMELPRCEVFQKEYQVVAHSDDMYVVAGWMEIGVSQGESGKLSVVQRITFIWKKEEDRLKLLHFHVSNPVEFQENSEYFLRPAGKGTFEYVKKLYSQKRRLIACGKHDQTYVLWNKDIVYIEAENTNSVIHCLNRDILSRESISILEKKLGEDFIKTHRSFIVNSRYITGIRRYQLAVRQGIELPIPEKKYREIKEKVLRAVSQRQNEVCT
ncbi:LytTR family transcriptional regulator DNA-binding domain-containing protein [Anaerostipes caccae]|uniref:LytTR family transcriptional regulator DNA-binding domain-containing protein n=1 Tax=Anaerostipes caccae TaxID=105841 RepID=UPI0038D36FB3